MVTTANNYVDIILCHLSSFYTYSYYSQMIIINDLNLCSVVKINMEFVLASYLVECKLL